MVQFSRHISHILTPQNYIDRYAHIGQNSSGIKRTNIEWQTHRSKTQRGRHSLMMRSTWQRERSTSIDKTRKVTRINGQTGSFGRVSISHLARGTCQLLWSNQTADIYNIHIGLYIQRTTERIEHGTIVTEQPCKTSKRFSNVNDQDNKNAGFAISIIVLP